MSHSNASVDIVFTTAKDGTQKKREPGFLFGQLVSEPPPLYGCEQNYRFPKQKQSKSKSKKTRTNMVAARQQQNVHCIIAPRQKAHAIKRQLGVIRALLDVIDPFPARKGNRKNVMQAGQDRVNGFTLGKTIVRHIHDRLCDSQFNAKFPELHLACQRVMRIVDPGFRYNCIQVNKNQQTSKHIDTHNVGPSYIVAFGDYEGGELEVYYSDGVVRQDINGRFVRFDGRIPHATTRITGAPRYSLVFFELHMSATPALSVSRDGAKIGYC